MLHLVGKYGIGLKAPSYYEIKEKYLSKEVIRINEMLDEYRIEWRKTGCSIRSDGWTDTKRALFVIFLVNSPKGTVFLFSIDTSDISKTAGKVFEMLDDVVLTVGVENVVQVVTDNAANYKAAGKMLMETRKNLFWTPCAAHCIDLILEDFGKKLIDHRVTIGKAKKITTFIYSRTMLISLMKEFTKNRDLIRSAVTRFATSYLTLGCVSELKVELMTMFSSPEWRSSKFSSLEVGKKVQSIILDNLFWKNVNNCLKAAYPLIRALRMVDGEEKPPMGFIYHVMDRAKEKIQMNFKNVKTRYEPIWEILNERWEFQLHRPLHAAAYYLNPHFHYDANFRSGFEIKKGLYECINTMVPNEEERTKIDLQLESFKNARGMFGLETTKLTRKKKSPAGWWDSYGDEFPELQKFAVRVLSLTCSSSGCERNWSAFEMVHTKKRNRLHQKRMHNFVFVMYNMKLMERQKKREATSYYFDSTEYGFDDFSSDNEWITENENPVLVLQKRWMRVLDKVAEGGNEDNDDDIQETGEVTANDIRAALDAEDDLVLHDDDDDEEDNVGGNENNIPGEDGEDQNIENLDEELMGDPSVPEEEYVNIGDDDDDLDGDGTSMGDLY